MIYRFLLVAITCMLVIITLPSTIDNISAKTKNQGNSINKICTNETCTIEVQNSTSNSTTTYTDKNLTDSVKWGLSILKPLFGTID